MIRRVLVLLALRQGSRRTLLELVRIILCSSPQSLRVDWRHDNILFEVIEQQRKEPQNGSQRESHQTKDVIGGGVAVRVIVKGSKQNEILVGEYQQHTEEKSNGKGGGKSFQHKSSQSTQYQVYNPNPYGHDQESFGASLLTEIHH